MQSFPQDVRHQFAPGFTMVELIVVIVLAGILAAVAGARYFGRSEYDHSAYVAEVRAVIRYGQKVAIAQNRAVFVRLNGTGVALCFVQTCLAGERVLAASGRHAGKSGLVNGVTDPCNDDAAWACERVPAGVAIATSGMFWFDALGVPYEVANYPNAASTFVRRDLTVTNITTGDVQHLFVEAQTGYAY